MRCFKCKRELEKGGKHAKLIVHDDIVSFPIGGLFEDGNNPHAEDIVKIKLTIMSALGIAVPFCFGCVRDLAHLMIAATHEVEGKEETICE